MKRYISLFAALVLFVVLAFNFYTGQEYLPSVVSGFFAGFALASINLKKRERSEPFQKDGVQL